MNFRKYEHVERFGHDEVENIDIGEVYVFPKLDGSNASVWLGDATSAGIDYYVRAGSRNRELSLVADNAGFLKWCDSNEIKLFMPLFKDYPNWRLYGEWLIPHTLKTYREEVWRRFWVFDVHDGEKYLPFEVYHPVLAELGFDVIEPLCVITNPSEDQLRKEVENNSYLILDGAGAGEGIVIKNYAWENRFGRQPWAKIVRNEFKEENLRQFGTTEKGGAFQVEAAIAEEFVTQALVEKTRAKIIIELLNEAQEEGIYTSEDIMKMTVHKRIEEHYRGKIIPRLLGTVFYELINEEIWAALKKHKFPVVDFKKLRSHSIVYTKKYAKELF